MILKSRPEGQKGLSLKETRKMEFLSQVRFWSPMSIAQQRFCMRFVFGDFERGVSSLGCR
jgi:hypothetical protein